MGSCELLFWGVLLVDSTPEFTMLKKTLACVRGLRKLVNMEFGALFDWDGVIIDSSAMHEQSWEMLAKEEQRKLPADHFKRGFGRKNQFIIPHILRWTEDADEVRRLSERKEALYRELVHEQGLKPLPGVKALLESLLESGIPCAVGSSTPRVNLDAVMETLGIGHCFQALVSGDDVAEGKPHPEVFLKGAEAIGVAPERCVVFEDAHYGIEAARRGGMKVVGCATTHPIEDLGEANLTVHSLEEVDLVRLRALFA